MSSTGQSVLLFRLTVSSPAGPPWTIMLGSRMTADFLQQPRRRLRTW
jgi:hypothetical protein